MDINNLKLLKETLSLICNTLEQEANVIEFIKNFIKKNNIKCTTVLDEHGNLLITKGKAKRYLGIVSHLDDVHHNQTDKVVYQNGDCLFAMENALQTGIAGDDKVGVFLCLRALKHFDNIKVAFFSQEERGCIGSKKVDVEFFKDCRFLVEPDRKGQDKGSQDFINHTNGIKVTSELFDKFAERFFDKHDYEFNKGTCTDIGALVNRDIGISATNLSCGYFNAHSSKEWVSIGLVEECWLLIKDMFEVAVKEDLIFPYIVPKYVAPPVPKEDPKIEMYLSIFKTQNLGYSFPFHLEIARAAIKTVLDNINKKKEYKKPNYSHSFKENTKALASSKDPWDIHNQTLIEEEENWWHEKYDV